jgi:DNA polymerase elongation subunit (family B)
MNDAIKAQDHALKRKYNSYQLYVKVINNSIYGSLCSM